MTHRTEPLEKESAHEDQGRGSWIHRHLLHWNLLGWWVGLLLVNGILLRQLSALLRSMHLPWQAAADLGQGPFEMSGLTGGPGEAFEVVSAWEAFLARADAISESSAVEVAVWWLLIDLLFIVAYVLVGLTLVGRNGLLKKTRRGMTAILDLTALALVVLAAIDFVENMLAAATIGWALRPERAGQAVEGSFTFTIVPRALQVAAVAKWLVAFLVLVPIVVLGVVQLFKVLKKAEVRQGLVMSRTQILAVVLFGAAMFAPIQIPDMILGWGLANTFAALLVVSFFSLSTGLWARLLIQADLNSKPPKQGPPKPWKSLAKGWLAASMAIAAIGWTVSTAIGLHGLAVAIGLVFGVIVLSIPARSIAPRRRDRPDHGSRRLPGLLAVLPLVLLGIGMLSSTSAWVAFHLPGLAGAGEGLTDFLSLQSVAWKPVLGAALVIVPLGLLAVIWRHDKPDSKLRVNDERGGPGPMTFALLILSVFPTAIIIAIVLLDPWKWGPFLGSVSITIAAFTAASYLGGLAVIASQGLVSAIGVPGAFRMFGLSRIPIVTLVAVWALINTNTVDPGDHHDVRVAQAAELNNHVEAEAVRSDNERRTDLTQQQLGGAFVSWRSHAVGEPVDSPCELIPGEECVYPATPLLLVAAEGGGIRAAYWTASVLDCLLEPRNGAPEHCAKRGPDAFGPASDYVFIASGASGGSVGIAFYVAETEVARTGRAEWVRETLGKDFLAAQLGWWLFAELPRGLFLFDAMDRAEVHERSLERAFSDEATSPLAAGMRNLYSGVNDEWVPRMMLSGASVLDGCQFNVSHLNVGVTPRPTEGEPFPGCLSLDQYSEAGVPAGVGPLAGAIDLADMLCQEEDIRLSTAAMLSSRFPFVSPAGRLAAAECAVAAQGSVESVKYVVDGGYVDNTGGLALASMWPSLDRSIAAYNRRIQQHGHCVVPFVVQIDNGGENPPAPGASPEIGQYSAPFQAIASATSQSRDARIKALLAGEFSRSLQHDTTGGESINVKLNGEPVLTRYARIFPSAEAALDAPLGWVMSAASKDLIARQLNEAASGAGGNLTGIEATQQWLSGDLTCTVVTPSSEPDGS